MKPKPSPQSPKPQKSPHVTAALFTLGDYGYAWAGHAMKLDIWEKANIVSVADRGSAEWNAAAFAACLKAYGKLRKRLPGHDLTLCVVNPPAGEPLPIAGIMQDSMACLRKLIPEMLPPETQGRDE
jgi:hypothetical protein